MPTTIVLNVFHNEEQIERKIGFILTATVIYIVFLVHAFDTDMSGIKHINRA